MLIDLHVQFCVQLCEAGVSVLSLQMRKWKLSEDARGMLTNQC